MTVQKPTAEVEQPEVEKAEPEKESLTERLAKSLSGKLDSAAHPTVDGDSAKPKESEEEAAVEPEGEEEKVEEAPQWTADQIGEFMKENPAWPDTLNKEGWARVPKEFHPMIKGVQAYHTRRDQARARREQQEAPPQTQTHKETEKDEERLQTIVDKMLDPSTTREAFEELLEITGKGFLKKNGIDPDEIQMRTLSEQAEDIALRRYPELSALASDEGKEALLATIAADDDLIADVQTRDPKVMALAIMTAGRRILDAQKATVQKADETKRKQMEKAKAASVAAKVKANAETPLPAAMDDGAGGSQRISLTDKSIPLEQRLRIAYNKKLAAGT